MKVAQPNVAMPRVSVAEFTTPSLSFAEDVSLYSELGFNAIGLSEEKIGTDPDALSTLSASGMQASSFFPIGGSLLPTALLMGAQEPEDRLRDLLGSIERCAPFAPAALFVTTGPLGEYGEQEGNDIVVAGLRELARACAAHRVSLAIELMHPSLRDEFSYVTSLACAGEVIELVQEPNVTIAFDFWHYAGGEHGLAELRDHAGRISSVHVDDRRGETRSWGDRVLPGDGIADLPGMIRALSGGGFTGWYEIEIVSDDGRMGNAFEDSLWKWEPRELVTAARDKFARIYEAAMAADGYDGDGDSVVTQARENQAQ